MTEIDSGRRRLASVARAAGSGIMVSALAPALIITPASGPEKKKLKDVAAGKKGGEVTPPEDLMREHGVLDRVLLIYEASIRKLSANEDDLDPGLITKSAEIIRDFINNYHEKSEENHVFPRFKAAGTMVDLVDT